MLDYQPKMTSAKAEDEVATKAAPASRAAEEAVMKRRIWMSPGSVRASGAVSSVTMTGSYE